MKNFKRAYIRDSKAYYAKALPDRIAITIQLYNQDGSYESEFIIRWHKLNKILAARLECFEDTWKQISYFKDLFDKMAEVEGQLIQEQEFCELLDSLEIIDITEYEKGKPKNKLK